MATIMFTSILPLQAGYSKTNETVVGAKNYDNYTNTSFNFRAKTIFEAQFVFCALRSITGSPVEFLTFYTDKAFSFKGDGHLVQAFF